MSEDTEPGAATRLEQVAPSRAVFVVEQAGVKSDHDVAIGLNPAISPEAPAVAEVTKALSEPEGQTELVSAPNPAFWRDEVAVRVSKYRARRRIRAPRYPSLMLKFESAEPARAAAYETPKPAKDPAQIVPQFDSEPEADSAISTASSNLIEFPRPWVPAVRPADELAEPVIEQPRILEVPEVLPPPPALGGILIEPPQGQGNEKRAGFEVPLQSAQISRRLLAAATDGITVVAAFALFAYVFHKINHAVPPLTLVLAVSGLLLGVFWSAYQYVMLVYTGTSPGLSLAKLELNRFDGSRVPRSLRRWRAIASILSGVSLGLGYAWCFLDEDGLCWHDRITRTYMAPKGSSSPQSRD